ncbi:MAG: family 10 glycosylhydrolase [Clostridia bacterium]|nr:family 10 glycosylhydrolase [Clostridia bacterium]
MKRLLTILLALLMLVSTFAIPASAKQTTIKADGIDSSRNGGNLIIYTPNMGDTTGTNEWGYEVIIENNVAVRYNKGNSPIPKNGFVLSGHDENNEGTQKNMGTWIKENVAIGDYVYYTSDGVVTVSDQPISETVFYDLTQTIHGVNTVRGTNQLIIYNKVGSKTNTNDWGYEIVCTAGVVTAMGGNNNTVPYAKGSFVVSGHGDAVSWLQQNIKLGMTASYDESAKTVTFSYDESAVTKGMEMLIPALEEKFNAARARYDYVDYEAIEKAIDDLDSFVSSAVKTYKKDKDAKKLAEARLQAEAKADEASLLISESRTVGYRGVWIRPTDTSAAQVDETVQKLYDKGINMICIETLYDCTMIMPMPENSLFETNPKFRHFDLLKAYIDACHKRDMELHLWMPIYYVGDSGSSNLRYSLGKKKPEWLSVSNTGKYSHQLLDRGVEGAGLMMLDPSNEEASNYLLNTYKYILETYDVDGFQLDYIRYFNRNAEFDMGYTDEALDAFEAKYGVRPKYDMNASYWKDWVNFRCEYINNFVARVRKLIDETRPGVLLGADVVPDPTESVSVNYQNYYNWLENKWLDVLFPMSYGYGHEEDIKDQTDRCGETAFIAVGLGIFMNELEPTDMHDQAVYNDSIYTDGSVYFEASSYQKKLTGDYLMKGIYRNKAITPTFDIEKAAKAQLEYASNRIKLVLVEQDALSESAGNKIIGLLNDLANSCTDKDFDVEKYNAVKAEIEGSGAKKAAVNRMLDDLAIAIKGYTVLNKELDLSDIPDLPDVPDYNESTPDESTPDESDPEVSGEASVEASDTESTDVDESGSDENEDDSGDYTVIIIVAAVVVIVVAVAAVFLLKKKGKK